MGATYNTGGALGSTTASNTQQSPSITLPANCVAWIQCVNSDGAPANVTSVKWDAAGVNETADIITADTQIGSYHKSTLARIINPTAKTSTFTVTWVATVGERIVNVLVYTSADSTTPNGTVAVNSSTTGTAISSGSITTVVGQQVIAFGSYIDTSGTGADFNSPLGLERVEYDLTPAYDGAASQTHSASGTTTNKTWTLSAARDGWIVYGFAVNDAPTPPGELPQQVENNARRNRPGRGPYSLGKYYRPFGETQRAPVAGSLNVTLQNDTLTASGALTIVGTLTKTNQNDTLSATGTITIVGALAKTNQNDALAAGGSVGSPVSGTVAATNQDDTINAAGTTTIIGTLSKTNQNDTLASSGTPAVLGTLAKTNQNDTISASGSVGSGSTGTVAATNANDTISAAGTTTVVGTMNRTNQNDTLSSSGTTTILGTLACTNQNDTISASGSSGTPPVSSFAWRWLGLWLHKLGF